MDEIEFLLAVKEYIERAEEFAESEHNLGRSFEELLASGETPELYDHVVERIINLRSIKAQKAH